MKRLLASSGLWICCLGLAATATAAPGDAEPAFSEDGFAFTAAGGGRFAVRASDIAVDSQGRPVVALRVSDCKRAGIECLSSSYLSVARFLPDGTADPTLGGDGELEPNALPRQGDWESVRVTDLATDGDAIVLAGVAGGPPEFWVGRLRADGTPDPAFGGGDGAVAFNSFGTSVHEQSEANNLAVDPDGRITVAGRAETDPRDNPRLVVARLLRDGRFDPTFSADGWLTEPVGGLGVYQTNGVALTAGGRVLVGAKPFGLGERMFAYTESGEPDAAFAGDGVLELAFSPLDNESHAFVVDGLGRILIGVGGTNPPELIRLTFDGSVDLGFGQAGHVPLVFPSARSTNRGATTFSLAVDAQYRPVVGLGPGITVARFSETGSLDTTFSQDGASSVFTRAGPAEAADIALSADHIVFGGSAGKSTLSRRGMIHERRLDAGPADVDADLALDDSDPCPLIFGDCPQLHRRFSHLRYSRPDQEHPYMYVRVRTHDPACEDATIKLYRKRSGHDRLIAVRRSTPQFGRTGHLRPGRYYARARAQHFEFGDCVALRSETEVIKRRRA